MSPPIYIRDKSPYCPRDSKEDRADKHELQYSAENQSENQAKDQTGNCANDRTEDKRR